MATETEICNMALAKIGQSSIINIDTDTSNPAVKCALHFDTVRDYLLRSYAWQFAITRDTLALDGTAPEFGYDHRYVLPADFLRLIDVYEPGGEYAIEGNYILTDDDEVQIWYVRQVTDTTEFDSLFVKVFTLALAVELANCLSQDKSLAQLVLEELRSVLAKANLVAAVEKNTPSHPSPMTWNQARTGGTTI
jgi:hypothetical protein